MFHVKQISRKSVFALTYSIIHWVSVLIYGTGLVWSMKHFRTWDNGDVDSGGCL